MLPPQIPLNIPLESSDFDAVGWQAVVVDAADDLLHDLSRKFAAKMQEARQAGNTKAEGVYALLAAATSFSLNIANSHQPFGPLYVFEAFRGPSLDDLNENHLQVLKAIAPGTLEPALRARLCDVVWSGQRRRDADMAAMAVTAYLEASRLPHKYEMVTIEQLERATQLGYRLGKTSPSFQKVIAHLEERLTQINGADDGLLSLKMMQLLQRQGKGDPAKYIALCDKLIKHPRQEQALAIQRQYLECKAVWLTRGGSEADARTARVEAAETYLNEAEAAWNSGDERLHGAALWSLRSAIEAFRQLGITDRAGKLHDLYRVWQETSVLDNTIHLESEPIDIQRCVTSAKDVVKGKTLFDALLVLALVEHPPKVPELRESVQEMLSQAGLYAWLPKVAKSSDGRDIALGPSYITDDRAQQEAALRTEMFIYATRLQRLTVAAFIEPARQQVLLEHGVRPEDLLPIVQNNPFVPPGHAYIYAKGLYAGLTGEYDIAVALLVPQLENSLRHMLQQVGLVVSSLESGREAPQDVHNLERLFRQDDVYRAKLVEIYGEDTVFDLEGLLEERWGSNLRNRLSHGLLFDYEYQSSAAAYAWWWALRLCCLPILVHQQEIHRQQQ